MENCLLLELAMLAYRLEYKGQGPFRAGIWEDMRNEIINFAEEFVDSFGTTFANYYDQRNTPPLFNENLQSLLKNHPNGELKFGFTSKELFMSKFGLDHHFLNNYRQQFYRLLDNSPHAAVRVYDVEPLCYHDGKDEVIYDVAFAELIAEAHTSEEFISL